MRINSINILLTIILMAITLAAPSKVEADDFGMDLPVVDRIVILGNVSFNDDILKKRMRTKEKRFFHILRKPRFRRDFLRRDIEAIRSLYNRNGFFEVSVNLDSVERNEKNNSVRIRILINEGPQTKVRSLVFQEQSLIPEKKLRKGLRLVEEGAYNPNLVEVDRYTLFSRFFEKGYLGALIACETRVDSYKVDIAWKIDPGKPIRVSGVTVAGNSKVRESLIRRELVIQPGEYFNLEKIVQSKQNLYDTGCYTSVEIEPRDLDVTGGKVNLNLQVRERKMGYIETGLGVGNVHANRVFAEWGQRNLLGRGYILDVKSEFAFSLFRDNDYSLSAMDLKNRFVRHEGELLFPHILSTWNTFSLGAFYERDATVEPIVIEAVSYNAAVSRRFSRHTSLLVGYYFERVRREEVVDEKAKSKRRSIDLKFRRDTRDFYFNPRRGKYISLEARYAGGLLGGEDHYYSLIPSYQEYRQISEQTVFAYRIRYGYSKAFGDSEETGLPVESRFFLGGGNSVRGYEENSLGPLGSTGEAKGGSIMLLTNVELRFPIPWISRYNFGGAVFFDGGNSWDNFEDISIGSFGLFRDGDDVSRSDYRFSGGFGIRYYTPVGPIRIDFGFPMVKTSDIDYGYRLHISLGQIF